jgi:putative FmdB family regulatory protein
LPLYRYQCGACGLQFDARQMAAKATEAVPCLDCEALSERMVPNSMTSTYNPTGDGSIRPQNTGVNSYDANVDRVIGDHAKTSYGHISKRHARKREILRDNPGVSGHDLSRTEENDYRIMSKTERQAAETARGLNGKAMDMISRHKKKLKQKESGSNTAT